jgi:hypothetical protein
MSTNENGDFNPLADGLLIGIGAEPDTGEVDTEIEIFMENAAAHEGIKTLGVMLALTVQDALAPALRPRRPGTTDGAVKACQHAKLGVEIEGGFADPTEVRRTIYICPFHPDELICNVGDCLTGHYLDHHADEVSTAKCFVCEEPLLDPILHERREDFTPIFAEVVLRQQLDLAIAEPGTGGSAGGPGAAPLRMLNLGLASGTLVTLPCAYLCPRHEDAAGKLPWRMEWPNAACEVG